MKAINYFSTRFWGKKFNIYRDDYKPKNDSNIFR